MTFSVSFPGRIGLSLSPKIEIDKMTVHDPKTAETAVPTPNAALFGNVSGELPSQVENWRECFPEIVGRSEKMQSVLQMVAKAARADCSVLINGASGTGKELIANALHRLSPRSSKRFVAINCSAIPESLLESELFGHEKGAFTGATGRKAGYFEMAHQGTLFLDEIGEMPQRLQAKLLRVLQEKQYTPVGGHSLKKADVRIIAATNVDLDAAVKDGSFRLDLYYRLNVLPIKLPSLKERNNDVIDLLQHFLECTNSAHNMTNPCYFSDDAVEALKNYSWPGNIRELQNVVERLVIFVRGGEIRREHLPEEIRHGIIVAKEVDSISSPSIAPVNPTVSSRLMASHASVHLPNDWGDGFKLANYIEDLENKLIQEALKQTRNNKQQAAKLLGLNRTTLVERIKKRKIGS